jgi:hypothetical protein
MDGDNGLLLESAVKQLPEAFVGLDLKASDFLHLA